MGRLIVPRYLKIVAVPIVLIVVYCASMLSAYSLVHAVENSTNGFGALVFFLVNVARSSLLVMSFSSLVCFLFLICAIKIQTELGKALVEKLKRSTRKFSFHYENNRKTL